MTSVWQRDEAERSIRDLLEAAIANGPQIVIDPRGVFEVTFSKREGTLEELFSTPGPIVEDDTDAR